MSDPDDRLTARQIILGGLFVIVVTVVVTSAAYLIGSHIRPADAVPTPTTITVAPTTTTTYPYANLRASLDDYCGAKGKGHAHIVVRNGAPIGGCSGR